MTEGFFGGAAPILERLPEAQLVTCPVAMTPATSEEEKVRFHMLNRRTGDRVESQYVDTVTGKPVDEDDEVKGYARGEDDYVLLEDEELESVALESARTIDIERFVPADSIDWIWYDTPYYLTPNDPVGEEAYCVIRDAMRATETVGVSRLVLYRRERAVMLKPRDKGIVLWTLRFGDEVRDPKDYFDAIDGKPDPELMRLIGDLIKRARSPGARRWSPIRCRSGCSTSSTPRRRARKRPRRTEGRARPEPPSNVINIMDALKRSVPARRSQRALVRERLAPGYFERASDPRHGPQTWAAARPPAITLAASGWLGFLRSASIGAAAARKSAHGSATEARRAGALRMVK